ncbi:MAG: hypothetical protein ACJ8FY_21975 [Gemmataceae bacterium]
MLSATDIQNRIRERPFLPFRLMTSSGQSFEVAHPELIMVSPRSLIVGTATKEDPSQFDQVARVALMHVTALEDMAIPPKHDANGVN